MLDATRRFDVAVEAFQEHQSASQELERAWANLFMKKGSAGAGGGGGQRGGGNGGGGGDDAFNLELGEEHRPLILKAYLAEAALARYGESS